MKPQFTRALRKFRLGAMLATAALLLSGHSQVQAQTNYTWNGTTNSTFGTTTNWAGGNVAPTGGSSDSRLDVNNAGNNALYYTGTQGTTTYTTTGRSLVIGSGAGGSGSMFITGGTFDSRGSAPDVIGNTGHTGTLTIGGGSYTNVNGGSPDFIVGFSSGGVGILNVNSGNFTTGVLQFGEANTSNVTGTVNLNGGILEVGNFREGTTENANVGGVTSTINFNGGTLRARQNNTTFIGANDVDTARVQAGGAIIDTNGFNVTIAKALIAGTTPGGGLTKQGAGILTLSGANTYTGTTTVSGGTLNLTGNRTAAAGNISVNSGSTLGVSNGDFSIGTFFVGGVSGTSVVNHTAGTLRTGMGGDQVLIGNGGFAGEYNLSGGTLGIGYTGPAGARGVMLGVNTGSNGTFNLSGTGHLNMTGANSSLQIGRSDSGASNTTNVFNQTGGTATIRYLRIGGNTSGSSNVNSTLSLTGGTFTAAIFDRLAYGNTNTALIHIGGTADVTLPAFPTGALGTGSTATLTFDGGTLRNLAASTNYLGNISSAQIMAGGARFNTAGGGNITINQNLLTHGSSTGGGLTKDGANTLTLTGTNTYTGLTTINAGGLRITNASGLGTTAAGTVVNGSGAGTNVARLELSGGITVTGEALTISGGGNFRGALSSFSGINEWAGNVTVDALNTRIGAEDGATLKVSGVIDSGANAYGLNIRNGVVASGGGVILSGANTYLGDTTLFIGKLQLDGGDDRLPVATRLIMGNVANTTEFDLNGRNQEIAGLSLAGGVTVPANNAVNNSSLTLSTLTVNTAAASPSTFAGVLTGNLALIKSGADILTLTGTNTYTGNTLVSGGTLLLGSTGSIDDSPVITVGSGATLDVSAHGGWTVNSAQTLAGSGTVVGNVIIEGTHSPGSSPGLLTHEGNLSYATGSNVAWELVANDNNPLLRGNLNGFDGINVTGNLDFTGPTTLDLFFDLSGSAVDWSDPFWSSNYFGTDGWLLYQVTGGSISNFDNLSINSIDWLDGNNTPYSGAPWGKNFGLYLDGNNIYLTYTPEPCKAVLLALGLLGLLARRRR